MAEALLRALLEERGIYGVSVASAGLLFEGRPAEPGAIAAMAKRGIDIGHHSARQLGNMLLADVDLVLTMEQRHVREVVVAGGSLSRTFTLPDLVVRAEAVPLRDEAFAPWLNQLAVGRSPEDVLRSDPRLEIEDPMGGSARRFRRTAMELAGLTDRFVAAVWPTSLKAPRPPAVDTWST